MAPPTVTYFVPGVTGRKKPRGTAKSRISASVDSGFAAQNAGFGVEGQEAVHAACLQQSAVFEQADVAIAAARAYGQQAGRRGLGKRKIRGPVQRDEVGLQGWISAPAFKAGTGRWSRHAVGLAPLLMLIF